MNEKVLDVEMNAVSSEITALSNVFSNLQTLWSALNEKLPTRPEIDGLCACHQYFMESLGSHIMAAQRALLDLAIASNKLGVYWQDVPPKKEDPKTTQDAPIC